SALELRETSLAESQVVHSPISHAKVEEVRITGPWAKIPCRLLRLTKNYAMRGVAVFVSINRFRGFCAASLLVIISEECSRFLNPANRGEEQHRMFRWKWKLSAATHHGRTQLCSVGRGNMLRKEF